MTDAHPQYKRSSANAPRTEVRSSRRTKTLVLQVCAGVILSLFLMRFFYVTESADQGETLGIVGLWIVALSSWIVIAWKSQLRLASLGWLDLSVATLAGGHIVSALLIIATTGDKRSATNLAWEWLGVGIGWFLLRQQLQEMAFRREILASLLATGVSIAGLGLYQHYVEFPQMVTRFGPMFDRLRQAEGAEAASLRKTMAHENIPIDGPGATLFEKRLRDSREPLGFFALANSLGGFLAVCMILLVALIASSSRVVNRDGRATWLDRYPLIRQMFGFILIIVLAWCLLLTKSRTAWIGTAVGLGALFVCSHRASFTKLRIPLVALAVLGLAGWGLTRVGGLDRQVFTEAPKSLQYRLQYWSATLRMIRDHILFGVGPGQFRWHYIFYKLPEASEEISDPHNLFLDVAANGGAAAAIGLTAICLLLVFARRKSSGLVDGSEPSMRPAASLVPYIVWGSAASAWIALLFSGADDRLLVILPLASALYGVIRRADRTFWNDPNVISIGCWSAAVGLATHLCGAGGIGMPAVSLLFLALIAMTIQPQPSVLTDLSRISVIQCSAGVAVSVGLLFALFTTGLRPVALAQEKLFEGDRLVQKGSNEAADIAYQVAASADRWASEPWRRRAEMAHRKAEVEQYRSNESFQIAVNLLQEAVSRDPLGFRDVRRLGEWWFERWQKTGDEKDVQQAVEAFKEAWDRYPTNSALMAQLAWALAASEADVEANEMARKALAQDGINRERGHVDRYLDEATLQRMKSLCEERTKERHQE